MIKELGLFYTNSKDSGGPGKVALNLTKGLKALNVEVKENEVSKYNGCLQLVSNYIKLPQNTLMGPNLVVIPPECLDMWKRFEHYVVPSKWCIPVYRKYDITKNANFYIWPSGIDTDFFNERKNIQWDCLIYAKRTPRPVLESIVNELKKLNLSFRIIFYGYYNTSEFLAALQTSRFCIVAAKTESQGVAQMEVMSTNTPCYILNKEVWDDYGPEHASPASSAPYFSEECGILSKDFLRFGEFLDNLNNYNPRSYILREHTLEKSAFKYLKILENINQ